MSNLIFFKNGLIKKNNFRDNFFQNSRFSSNQKFSKLALPLECQKRALIKFAIRAHKYPKMKNSEGLPLRLSAIFVD